MVSAHPTYNCNTDKVYEAIYKLSLCFKCKTMYFHIYFICLFQVEEAVEKWGEGCASYQKYKF